MNVISLAEHLSRAPDSVITVLEEVGFNNIAYNTARKSVRFARQTGRNPSSIAMDLNTLSYICFSTNERGNLYTLIMSKLHLTFPQALNFIASTLKLDSQQFNRKIKLPFGGFYKNLLSEINAPELSMNTYDDALLIPYQKKFNIMFLRDGINFQTQDKFNIGYDLETNRITIPIYTLEDKLCGILGRLNDIDCPKEKRYLPIIPCSRSLTLYGYTQNYSTIQQKGLCLISEAEKSVMQMDSYGCHIGLSTSGCYISPVQAKYIKSLMIPRIVLTYDEGLEEEAIREEARKLHVSNPILKTTVGYVFDRNNDILKKGSKKSPSDLGKEKFTHLIKHHITWL